MLIIITVPKFTFEWLFPLKNFLKSLTQGEGTSDPEQVDEGGTVGVNISFALQIMF